MTAAIPRATTADARMVRASTPTLGEGEVAAVLRAFLGVVLGELGLGLTLTLALALDLAGGVGGAEGESEGDGEAGAELRYSPPSDWEGVREAGVGEPERERLAAGMGLLVCGEVLRSCSGGRVDGGRVRMKWWMSEWRAAMK